MTRQQFVDKFSNHLAGKFTLFAFTDTSGPGVAARTRSMVLDIQKTVELMWDAANRGEQPASNGHADGATLPLKKVGG